MADGLDLKFKDGSGDDADVTSWISVRHYLHAAIKRFDKPLKLMGEGIEADIAHGKPAGPLFTCADSAKSKLKADYAALMNCYRNLVDDAEKRLDTLQRSGASKNRPKSMFTPCENLVERGQMNILRANGQIARDLKDMISTAGLKVHPAQTSTGRSVYFVRSVLEGTLSIDDFVEQSTDRRNERLSELTMTPTFPQFASVFDIQGDPTYESLTQWRAAEIHRIGADIKHDVSEENKALLEERPTALIDKYVELAADDIMSDAEQMVRVTIEFELNHYTSDYRNFKNNVPTYIANLVASNNRRSGVLPQVVDAIPQMLEEAYGVPVRL